MIRRSLKSSPPLRDFRERHSQKIRVEKMGISNTPLKNCMKALSPFPKLKSGT
jgi:hypothetical protein